jgi:hypothetical protein
MIPIVLRGDDQNLDEGIMSGILVQVKNREAAQVVVIDKSSINFFPKTNEDDYRPYIALVMQLGLQTVAAKRALSGTTAQNDQMLKTPSKMSVRRKKSSRLSALHPRFSIQVTGCSKSVYKVVGDHKDLYAYLLGGRDIEDEHPRPYALAAVRRMKPFWNPGPDCFDWANEPAMNDDPVAEEPQDRLLIGVDAINGGTDSDDENLNSDNDLFT